MFVDVVLPSRQYRVFTYRVPVHFQQQIQIGSTVVVPLGQAVVSGVVVTLEQTVSDSTGWGGRGQMYRDVISVETGSVDHRLEPLLIQLIQRVATYYLAPFSSCLPLIIPPHAVKVASRVFLTEEGREVLAEGSLSADDIWVLRTLQRRPKGLLRSTFCRSAPVKPTTFGRLKKNGWVEERPVIRSSPSGKSMAKEAGFTPECPSFLSDSAPFDQGGAAELPPDFEGISQALNAGVFQERLCVGSEVSRRAGLMEAVTRVFTNNRRAIILAPEIHDVEALAFRCRQRWGERVGVFHGDMATSLKIEEWGRVQRGDRDLVVGTRSALFLPLSDVGLIWMEQEEDASYKEEHVPYYHAREVARMRAELESALVAYASSLPSLETYLRFQNCLRVPQSDTGRPVPTIAMVDMREVSFGTILSPLLSEKMADAMNRGESVILFLNRKGFSYGLLCKDCGHLPVCSVCQVTLKLFQRPSRLLCSYCGHEETPPEVCAKCQGTVFRFTGVGTQRVEEEVARQFPSATIARFDRDQVKNEQEADGILSTFGHGKIQILIGTEWLFHRLTPPKAALVGLPQADLGLHIPDFRSAERTYHTLVQAMGMAGLGVLTGEVLLQTRMPDHHVLQAIGAQDPTIFYGQELALRELLGYPPFSHLLLLVITGTQPAKVQLAVEFFRESLERLFPTSNGVGSVIGNPLHDSVLGPIHSKKSGGTQKTRTLFLVKTMKLPVVQQQMRVIQRDYRARFPNLPVVVETHVDPIDIQ